MINMLPNEQLKNERQRRGWSRQYVAEQIGVADPKTIGRWERGVAFPSAYFLQRLCTLYGMFAHDLGLLPAERKNITPADAGGRESHVFIISGIKKSPGTSAHLIQHEHMQHISDGILRASLGLQPTVSELLCRWSSLVGLPDASMKRL